LSLPEVRVGTHLERTITLQSTDKAKEIFDAARLYSEVAKFVNGSGKQPFLMPSQVVAALSLELYFKCLYYLENGIDFKVNDRYSHDFALLFQALTEDARKAIETAFGQSMSARNMGDIKQLEEFGKIKVDIRFEETLKTWSKVFTEVRYLYEAKAHKNMVFFPEMEHAVVTRILKVKPEWK
jgi:hypothetical protein